MTWGAAPGAAPASGCSCYCPLGLMLTRIFLNELHQVYGTAYAFSAFGKFIQYVPLVGMVVGIFIMLMYSMFWTICWMICRPVSTNSGVVWSNEEALVIRSNTLGSVIRSALPVIGSVELGSSKLSF